MTHEEELVLMFKDRAKYKQIKAERNEKYYRDLLQKDRFTLPFYLYHGTDAKVVRMDRNTREEFFAACNRVIETLYAVLNTENDNARLKELERIIKELNSSKEYSRYETVVSDIVTVGASKRNDPLYQYGNLYLAKYTSDVVGYAIRAREGGEIGKLAHSLVMGAKLLGINLDSLGSGIATDIQTITNLANKPAEPVLFCFQHLDLTKLRNSAGGAVMWEETRFFRYLSDVELDMDHASSLPANCTPLSVDYDELFARIKIY